ncbi:hypothetical protein NEOLEDRAFT_719998 [Neolentinus lepideus HHB14362 ss-1]|uniref:Endopeptidase S2P n=1 Tax=Neolentinus lepideus HHB14362 ss-1 TaxID=1314782 RepID=A0A165Q622_9AGAM|nr:hypothetical protein NEOLEDRAFT_719998 [Neolentinus lepideus HHB14362 ss-1]
MTIGASLSLLLPSAFVKLSSPSLASLSPPARLRIIASGAFHNLLMWVVLVLLISSPIGKLGWRLLGYADVGAYGRVVTGFDDDSDLQGYLPFGSLITKLDDISLNSTTDVWTRHLTQSTQSTAAAPGWCIGQDSYLSAPSTCCSSSSHDTPPSSFACFSSRCLDPLSVMNRGHARCISLSDCASEQVCVMLDERESLLRITFLPEPRDRNSKSQVVVWRGPRIEVYEQVRVGTMLPGTFTPLWLPDLTGVFFEYLATIALSLYFFNLLPLPYLDGVQLLDALLDYISAATSGPSARYSLSPDIELDAIEAGSSERMTGRSWSTRTRSRWKERLTWTLRVYTIVMSVTYIVLGMVEWIIRR